MMNWKRMKGNDRGLILSYYPYFFLDRLKKTTKTLGISGLWAEILIWDLPNMMQEC
jgi:hypothetical protein